MIDGNVLLDRRDNEGLSMKTARPATLILVRSRVREGLNSGNSRMEGFCR